jgi:hypothetical protein
MFVQKLTILAGMIAVPLSLPAGVTSCMLPGRLHLMMPAWRAAPGAWVRRQPAGDYFGKSQVRRAVAGRLPDHKRDRPSVRTISPRRTQSYCRPPERGCGNAIWCTLWLSFGSGTTCEWIRFPNRCVHRFWNRMASYERSGAWAVRRSTACGSGGPASERHPGQTDAWGPQIGGGPQPGPSIQPLPCQSGRK